MRGGQILSDVSNNYKVILSILDKTNILMQNANIKIEIRYFLAALKVINWCVGAVKGRIRLNFLIKLKAKFK